MNWDYVAGFLDGEGTVIARWIGKKFYTRISFANINKEVLEDIKNFLGVGHLYFRARRIYELIIYKWRECLRIAQELLPRAIVKKEALKTLISNINNKKWRTPPILDCEASRIRELYWKQGKSLGEIARKYNTFPQYIWRFMKKRGIPRRTLSTARKLYLGSQIITSGSSG